MLGDVVQRRGCDVVIHHMLIVVELHGLAGDGAVAHAVGHMGGLQVVGFKLQHFTVARLDEQHVAGGDKALQLQRPHGVGRRGVALQHEGGLVTLVPLHLAHIGETGIPAP